MISLEQVVAKMAEEIEQAKESSDPAQVREHVRAIRLLADLVLDEPSKKEKPTEISEQELHQMMGSRAKSKSEPEIEDKYGQSSSDSLLDF